MNDRVKKLLEEKIDNLNKPKGSLGRLEALALQVGLAQETLSPALCRPWHFLFAGDHGIEAEGVSASPREVTWQQCENYVRGGGGVNVFCRQHGFGLSVVDVGVDHEFEGGVKAAIVDRKIRRGTRNFLYEAAMTAEEWQQALTVGREMVDEVWREGTNVVCFGEMGVGNTSASSVLMHLLTGIELERCVGAGSGLTSDGVRHKLEVLRQAVNCYRQAVGREGMNDAGLVGRWFCGYEMAAAVGGMIEAARRKMLFLVDGFIMTACAMLAEEMVKNDARFSIPDFRLYVIYGHVGDECGHRLMLDWLGVQPLLSLGMRLGEGTGALCAWPILDSAVRLLNEMDNFYHARITKYF